MLPCAVLFPLKASLVAFWPSLTNSIIDFPIVIGIIVIATKFKSRLVLLLRNFGLWYDDCDLRPGKTFGSMTIPSTV